MIASLIAQNINLLQLVANWNINFTLLGIILRG